MMASNETYTKHASSNVASSTYNHETQELQIEFNNGSTYTYFEVSEKDFKSFISAPSTGQAFHSIIKPHRYVKN